MPQPSLALLLGQWAMATSRLASVVDIGVVHVHAVHRHEVGPVDVPLLQIFDRGHAERLVVQIVPADFFPQVQRQHAGPGADIYRLFLALRQVGGDLHAPLASQLGDGAVEVGAHRIGGVRKDADLDQVALFLFELVEQVLQLGERLADLVVVEAEGLLVGARPEPGDR